MSGKDHVATSGCPGHRGAKAATSSSRVMMKSATGAPLSINLCQLCGASVGIAMLEEIGYKDTAIKFPKESPVSEEIKNILNGIKIQKIEDKFGWIVPVA